ncbi:MAG: GNAT family N-acetyltransferase [Firmicutes bacterium]|nr:GNAT family N-acetyltransferase [Bacillota bacterium]
MKAAVLHQLKQLYREGFPEDNEQAVEWFFSRVTEENTAFIEADNQIVSAGYIIEKPARLFGKDTVLPFLSALSTRREYRRQGKIQAVLEELFARLIRRGHSFCALHPFNYTFYKRFGFFDVSFCAEKSIAGGQAYSETVFAVHDNLPAEVLSRLVQIEKAFTAGFDNYLIFGEKEILAKRAEFAFDTIPLRVFSDSNGIFAYCFAYNGKIEHYATSDREKFERCEPLKGLTYYDFTQNTRPFAQGYLLTPAAQSIKLNRNLITDRY